MDPEAPFAAFEGWWFGEWGDLEVAHVWFTVAPGIQLVALADGPIKRRGINLSHDGALCGLVVSPDGTERIHRGRFDAAADGHPARLVWSTPTRTYYERVDCDEGRAIYEIVEEINGRNATQPGRVARYRPTRPT